MPAKNDRHVPPSSVDPILSHKESVRLRDEAGKRFGNPDQLDQVETPEEYLELLQKRAGSALQL